LKNKQKHKWNGLIFCDITFFKKTIRKMFKKMFAIFWKKKKSFFSKSGLKNDYNSFKLNF